MGLKICQWCSFDGEDIGNSARDFVGIFVVFLTWNHSQILLTFWNEVAVDTVELYLI